MNGLGYGVADQADRNAAETVAYQDDWSMPTYTPHHVDDVGDVVLHCDRGHR